jgi:hypothetical protein
LLLVPRDLGRLYGCLRFNKLGLNAGDVRFASVHLLRAAVHPLAQLGELLVNAVQLAKYVSG